MYTKEKLTVASAQELLTVAEHRLTASSEAVHLAVHGSDEHYAQGAESLLDTEALGLLLRYFGTGTALGTEPSAYIFRHGVKLDHQLSDLSVLNGNGVVVMRAEYAVAKEQFSRKSFIAVRTGRLVIAQTTNGITHPIFEADAEQLHGIIKGDGR
jgi:hypothetical protein